MPSYWVHTLGCKANFSDTQVIDEQFKSLGFVSDPHQPDWIVVNSCTVTNEADRQSVKLAAKLKRKHGGSRVVLTGCLAQVDSEKAARESGADFVISNQDKFSLMDLVLKGSATGHALWAPPKNALHSHTRTRAFLKIQEGCNAFCTYCIIPFARGPARSLDVHTVVLQVGEACAAGYREVVLTGTNIGDYGTDFGKKKNSALVGLVSSILKNTPVQRLRLSSLDPTEITSELTDLVCREPRICPHFHVSVQSVDSGILRRMKRRYRSEDVVECLERISRVEKCRGGFFVGMDLITGFPGETDACFESSYKLLATLPWSRIHVFPYSERSDTPATRLDGVVGPAIRKARARKLQALSLDRLKSHYHGVLDGLSERGEVLKDVLLEGACRGPDGLRKWMAGYTPHYLRLLVSNSPGVATNSIVSAIPHTVVCDARAGEVYFLAHSQLVDFN